MADWTNIPNANLEPGAPARALDALAFRENPIAIAEGAAGAPRIAGQQGPAVQAGGLFTTNAERDWVLGRMAVLTAGAVGTPAFLQVQRSHSAGPLSPGDTQPGSALKWSSTAGASTAGPSGTWRLLGFAPAPANVEDDDILSSSSWLRIS